MAAPASDKNDGSKAESSGGIKAMLPLILNIVLMPVVAFAMTKFVLLPSLNSRTVVESPTGDAPEESDGEHSGASTEAHSSHPPASGGDHGSKSKEGGHGGATDKTHMLDSVTVNVAGTMGSRLLMAKIGVRGSNPKLEELVKARSQDLRDAASTLLQTKTMADIERAGSRTTIKSELKNAFQRVLGPGSFTEIVMPDLAVQ
jgi:flagellar basal body-associated protein FliL